MKASTATTLLLVGVANFLAALATEGPISLLASSMDSDVCGRATSQQFVNPVNVSSRNGYLDAYLSYQRLDVSDSSKYPYEHSGFRYCYVLENGPNKGQQAPVLRAYPGDTMLVTLTNELPVSDVELFRLPANDYCLERIAYNSSTNLHFHGFHSQPICHDDNVIMTIVNSGGSFTYAVEIPSTQPPGLYWYHPHMHHVADAQVGGGATGVIVVEGIENIQPEVQNLPEQILVFRRGGFFSPTNYVSLNFIPIYDPATPVQMKVQPNQPQFWRIANTMADSELNLTLTVNNERQIFRVIAQDGVAVGNSQTVEAYDTPFVFIPAGGRVEVIVPGFRLNTVATLETAFTAFSNPNSTDPTQQTGYQLMQVTATRSAPTPPRLPFAADTTTSSVSTSRVSTDLLTMTAAAEHTVVFYAETSDFNDLKWFVNVDGEHPYQMFDPTADPAIIGTQGTVEDWTIINNTTENHDFHIHQMHFIVLEVDGVPVGTNQKQYQDTVAIPHQTTALTPNQWGQNLTSHSVKIRVDFTGDVAGKFVMHCHLLDHEDHGMMRIVEVVPNTNPTLAPVPHPLVSDDLNNDDDNRNKHVGMYVAIGILSGAVLVLILVVIYYCIFSASSSSADAAEENGPATPGRQTEMVNTV